MEVFLTDTFDYDVEVTRILGAPPDRVYQAFVDPSQFVQWVMLRKPESFVSEGGVS